ncbi:MAG: hypothetical protein ACXVPU_01235 [Bacteroidia bacterium]
MKNKIKKAGIILLVLIFIGSCLVFIFHKKIVAHFIPEVQQNGDIHIKIKGDTAYVNTMLIVKNKSFLNIKIDTIKYKISMFDKTYMQNEKFLGIVLSPHGSDSVDFSIKIPHTLIIKDLKEERKNEDSASYAVNVFLQYSTDFWKSEMPINRAGRVKIPQPPELKIEDIKWKKIRLKSVSADVKIKIINHSIVALSIKKVEYNMNVSGQGNLKGEYTEPIEIKPKGITFINVPIEINTKNVGKTIFQVLINKDQYNYTLAINAVIESTEPEKKVFYLDLTKAGEMELKK